MNSPADASRMGPTMARSMQRGQRKVESPAGSAGVRRAGWPLALLASLLSGVACRVAVADSAALPPAEAVAAWVRLKGDARGRINYEWVRGAAHGLPDDARSQPLFRFESVTVRRFLPQGPGRWREVNYACRLYRDFATGAVIDRMVNPFNGREVPLPARCSDGPTVLYSSDGVSLERDIGFRSSALDAPMRLELTDLGRRYVLRREAHSEYRAAATGQLRRETSVDVFSVDARAFRDRRIADLQADYHWSSVTQWMPALGMGERGGRMLWSIDGRKFSRATDLPRDFRLALLAAVPDALTRPLE
ncbi:MAG: DUF1838 family protein [Steroidobacteraceae bacterium]